jgi:hypothetical protein
MLQRNSTDHVEGNITKQTVIKNITKNPETIIERKSRLNDVTLYSTQS